MKIDFVVPGFSKCGTTSLCALLNLHPEICVSDPKEPGYFSYNFSRGEKWYQARFSPQHNQQRLGEGSTTYSSEEFAAIASKRLSEHSPDVKLIFMARDPFTRLESSFREMHDTGFRWGVAADLDIGKTLESLPNMIADTRYWRLLNCFRQHFSDDRILLVFQEDLELNPAREIRRCLEFLNVDPAFSLPEKIERLRSSSSKRYETWLLRYIRRTYWLNQLWSRLSTDRQEWWGNTLGLRVKFTQPVEWSPELRQRLEAELAPEALALLQYAGRPASQWPWCEKYATTQVRNAA